MSALPEFDPESLFGNWGEAKDGNGESNAPNVDSTSGALADAPEKTHPTADDYDLYQIMDAVDAAVKCSNGDDSTFAAGNPISGVNNNAHKSGGSDVSVNAGSSSTFSINHPLNQAHNHPLAMTSMASCPPYASAAPSQNFTSESSTMLSQQQQQLQQAQPLLALGPSFNPATRNNSNGNNISNNIASSSLTYNSSYSTHLRELTANFRNNPNISTMAVNGFAVNGFHPQVNARVNHVFPLSNSAGGITLPATQQTAAGGVGQISSGTNNSSTNNVRVRGKRGGKDTKTAANVSTHTRNSRERNNREQLRAQKITQLISELRENMEKGGWEKEMKSKYQTLSECKEYVQYLVSYHKRKEADIARTRRLVEEKASMEANSGNLSDSVTSSITEFTTRSTSPGSDSKEYSSLTSECEEHNRKRKRQKDATTDNDDVNASNQTSSKEGRSSRSCKKEMHEEAQKPHQSSADSSCEDDEDEDNPRGRNISFDKGSSSVSDMTDSNKSCTTNNNTKSSTGSISSTAAVVRGVGSSQHSPSHTRHRRRSQSPRRESGSNNMSGTKVTEKVMDTGMGDGKSLKKKKKRNFDYDYREVFLRSNVPQLIATLSGKIVVWNDFFLHATGLSKRDIGRLTMFSIVQADQLSTLYKMVAKALAKQHNTSSSEVTATSGTSSKENTISPKSDSGEDWQVVTLRCIQFPLGKNEDLKRPLFLTISLMDDANNDQRCFHCTLSDIHACDGKYSTISSKLLDQMFAQKASLTTTLFRN